MCEKTNGKPENILGSPPAEITLTWAPSVMSLGERGEQYEFSL